MTLPTYTPKQLLAKVPLNQAEFLAVNGTEIDAML
jgi:hypothetical protein